MSQSTQETVTGALQIVNNYVLGLIWKDAKGNLSSLGAASH